MQIHVTLDLNIFQRVSALTELSSARLENV